MRFKRLFCAVHNLFFMFPTYFLLHLQSIENSTMNDINTILTQLAAGIGSEVTGISQIAESGSSRKYFRLLTTNGSLIGTYSNNIAENEAFFSLTDTFAAQGLNTPRLVAVSDDKTCYLQTDFGDDTLFAHVQKALADDGYNDDLVRLYKLALSNLVKFQLAKGIDYGKAYPAASFDRAAIMGDLNYFKYYFLKMHYEIDFNETLLDADFERFADIVDAAPRSCFMYRDFQSRNIMIYDNDTYFIDYQGGRKGPLQYDVVSLLYQVKAKMPAATRHLLLNYYKSELKKAYPDGLNDFDKYYPAFVYLRLLQVLGAYGYRGLIQRKKHFVESIPYAIFEIIKHNKQNPLNDMPELQRVISQLNKLKTRYPKEGSKKQANKLCVSVCSFSFKKGYPENNDGNGGGHVFDCRALPNPGREERFKKMTGLEKPVIDFLVDKPQTKDFLDYTKSIVNQSVTNYIERGFTNLSVAFGCTGGKHRSVFFAQSMFNYLRKHYPYINVKIDHKEQNISASHNAKAKRTAFILAAGLGTRLGALTANKPKALVEVGGKTLLQRNIENAIANGFNHIVINAHHFHQQIKDFVKAHDFGIHIDISDEKDLLMNTGGGIAKAMPLLSHSDIVMVHNVDIFSDIDLKKIANDFIRSKDDAWLVTQDRNTSRKLLFDNDGKLIGWRNVSDGTFKWVKGECSDYEELAFNGIHFFKPALFGEVAVEPSSVIDIYLDLAKQKTIRRIKLSPSYWFDLGKPQEIEQAEKLLKDIGNGR